MVPGVTVDLNKNTLSVLQFIWFISLKTLCTISKFIDPSEFDGVGTDTNTKSDSNVSDNECVDLDSSFYCICPLNFED